MISCHECVSTSARYKSGLIFISQVPYTFCLQETDIPSFSVSTKTIASIVHDCRIFSTMNAVWTHKLPSSAPTVPDTVEEQERRLRVGHVRDVVGQRRFHPRAPPGGGGRAQSERLQVMRKISFPTEKFE